MGLNFGGILIGLRCVVVSMGGSQINIGPLDPSTRDDLAEFRDERDLPNYNEAVRTLLDRCGEGITHE